MTDSEIERTRSELLKTYPECHVKVADDKREMVAEISDGFAVAVIERSLPHFHRKTIAIEPGQIHFARAAGDPVWIEVESVPSWSADDHFVV